MKKALIGISLLAVGLLGYACKDDDQTPTTVTNPVQLTATLNGASGGSATATGTGTFAGNISQGTSAGSSQSSRVLSYTVTYSGISPTAISLDPAGTSTSATSGSSNYNNSILLAGSYPSTITIPGSGTSTIPGSGTSTIPGSGTSTIPGSGTSTIPGSGTSTIPGSGTAVTLTSPVSGTVSMAQGRADSLSRGLYRLNIRSATYPNGEIGGTVQVR